MQSFVVVIDYSNRLLGQAINWHTASLSVEAFSRIQREKHVKY